MKQGLLFLVLWVIPLFAFSEDIELYLSDPDTQVKTKPKVLLIVDTSGSMVDTETIKTPFDSGAKYKVQGNFSGSDKKYIYYVVGSPDVLPSVDDPNEHRRFLASKNNCSASYSSLIQQGFYTGHVREHKYKGLLGSWEELSTTQGEDISLIDCADDTNLDYDNAKATPVRGAKYNINKVGGNTVYGYPVDGLGVPLLPIYYDSDVERANVNWGGNVVTLYTDEYLRWEKGTRLKNDDPIGTVDESRLNIAKQTLRNLISSIPSVEFGLEVFNFNNKSDTDSSIAHGGRIAFGIQEMTATAKGSLLTIIKDDLHASGWTPLCESYYEAYHYFSGLPVKYGAQDINGFNGVKYHNKDKPGRDETDKAEVSGVYKSPYGGCSNKIFVILITDGLPTNDKAADQDIKDLQTKADPNLNTALNKTVGPISDNYLPVLSAYMSTNDINPYITGVQTAQLYTVGFSSGADGAAPVLQAAADNGGGKYYDASNPSQLGSKLQEAITSILSVNTSFTAPSVATNSFDRTETLDSVYYAMFTPSDTARWSGNLKKLKIKEKILVDRDDESAINSDGGLKADAKTFWSNSNEADGDDVSKGGVVEMFNNKTNERKVYSDIGAGDGKGAEFPKLTYNNLKAKFDTEAKVNALFDATDTTEAKEYLNWAKGITSQTDSDDSDSTYTYRKDLFGDPLHSKPVVLNYGGTSENQDVRILVGTNAGVLHMFKDEGNKVDESWAFMPTEFFSNIKTLKENLPTSNKVYGIDGRITAHIVDKGGDGTIDIGEDTAWVFFGLRRGGSSYYGLDVTDPDTPKLLWKITAGTEGFDKLGQTWSQPQVGYSKYNVAGVPKPVLIFGAGYSTAKDRPGPYTSDSVGTGIYMVDAESGQLLWSTTPADTSAINTQFSGFTDSIPSKIAILDSDADGLIDRLYTGDTGGNIFRIDMPGNKPFDTSGSPWTVFKLAELGGESTNDRRFFNAPSIVRTFFTDTIQSTTDVTKFTRQETPYDAILIGSGDRTKPKGKDVNDEFFLIQDENVRTQSFVKNATAPAKSPPEKITYDDLYNFTDNPFGGTLSELDKQRKEKEFTEKSGWRYNFSGLGEKSTAGAIVVEGVAYFTSFEPGADSKCELNSGTGNLYAIDLYKGNTIYDWRKKVILTGMPDTPVISSSPLVLTGDDDNNEDDPPSVKEKLPLVLLTGGAAIPIGSTLTTSRTYQYVTENN